MIWQLLKYRKLLKRVALWSVVLVILLAVSLLHDTPIQGLVLDQVLAKLSAKLERKIQAEHIRISLFTGRVSIAGASFEAPSGFADHTHTATLDSLEARFSIWRSIRERKVILTQARLKRPHFYLTIDKNRRSSINGRTPRPKDPNRKRRTAEEDLSFLFTVLQVEDLTFDQGRFTLNLEKVPLRMCLDDIRAYWSWNAQEQLYDIGLDVADGNMTIKDVVRWGARVRTVNTKWHPAGWTSESFRFDLHGGGTSIDFSYVNLVNIDSPHLTAQARAEIDLDTVNEVVRLPFDLAGNVTVDLSMLGEAEDFSLEGQLCGGKVVSPWGFVDTLESEIEVRTRYVEIHSLLAEAAGGQLTTRGLIGYSSDGMRGLLLDGEFSEANLHQVGLMYGFPRLPDYPVSGAYTLRMDAFDVQQLEVACSLFGNAPLAGNSKPLRLQAPFRLQGKTLYTEGITLRQGALYAAVRGRVPLGRGEGTVDLRGDYRIPAVRDLSQFLSGFLSHWSADGSPPFNLEKLVPRGSASGVFRVDGDLPDVRISGQVKAKDTTVALLKLREATARFTLHGGDLLLEDVRLDGQKPQESLSASTFRLRLGGSSAERAGGERPGGLAGVFVPIRDLLLDLPDLDAPVQIEQFDLGALLSAVSPDLVELGLLNGQVELRKALGERYASGEVDVTLGPGRYGTQSFEALRLRATLAGPEIALDLGLHSEEWGEQHLTGSMNLETGLNLGFDLRDLRLEELPPLAQAKLAGLATVSGRITGSFAEPLLSGDVALSQLRLGHEPLGNSQGSFVWSDRLIEVNGQLLKSQLDLAVALRLRKGLSPDLDFSLGLQRFEFHRLVRGWTGKEDLPLSGELDGTIRLNGPLGSWDAMDGSINLRDCTLRWGKFSLTTSEFLHATLTDGELAVESLRLNHPQLDLSASGSLAGQGRLGVEAALTVDLSLLPELNLPITAAQGLLEWKANLSGTTRQPLLLSTVNLHAASVVWNRLPETPLSVIGDGELNLEDWTFLTPPTEANPGSTVERLLERLQLRIHRLAVEAGDSRFSAQGVLPGSESQAVSIEGDANLDLARQLLGIIRNADGRADIQGEIIGSLRRPQARLVGELQARSARFTFLPWTLTNLSGRLIWENELITLQNVRANADRGTLNVEGSLFNRRLVPEGMDLNVRFREVAYGVRRNVSLRGSGQLRLNGPLLTPTIEGTATLDRLRYTEPISYQSFLLETSYQLVVEGTRETAVTEAVEFNPRLNVKIEAPNTIEVDNNLANTRVRADLWLLGTYQQPVLNGRMEVVRGELYFQSQSFDITSGNLEFVDPERIDPYVDLRARGVIGNYTVTIQVQGSMKENYTVNLTSEPPLDPTDIYLLLLTGKTQGDLTAGSTNASGSDQALSMVSGYLSHQIEDNLQYLGIDRFSVDTSFTNEERLARVTIGKKISEDLTVLYSTEVPASPRSVIIVKLNLTENLFLIGERKEDGKLGGDLRFRFHFR